MSESAPVWAPSRTHTSRLTRTCARCGIEFSFLPSKSHRRYCSPACVYPPIEERFWSKVNRDGPVSPYCPDLGACWLWMASTYVEGYGQFYDGSRCSRAYAWAYRQAYGPIPRGLEIDHICRVTGCVNPRHLRAVTTRVNVLNSSSVGAVNAAKTACVNGHPFDTANTYVHPRTGWRKCRACMRAQKRARYQPSVRARKTHCPQGHAYDKGNTIWNQGRQTCRVCKNAYMRRWYAQRGRGNDRQAV